MTQVPLLDIQNLKVDFATRDGMVHALEDVSFKLARGETMGLVGESGSGKSVSAYAVMRLLGGSAHVTADRMICGGVDLRSASDAEVAAMRGKRMTMIFQNARAALNPIRPIGEQIVDVLRAHRAMPKREARKAAVAALAEVRIPDPERRYHAYPFELSGGMCQRVMIALAFASEPELLIADEPTTGLDVTTQAVIMDLIREKSSQRRMSTILITHDLTLAAEYCDRFAVMHAGHIVEQGTTSDIFQRATHPYTGLLMKATPHGAATLSELAAIPGSLPDLRRDLPPCRFAHRCPQSTPGCAAPLPRVPLDASHEVACHMPWKESA
ncbi:MAG: ABC transporter ATP-binding protein [Rhodobacteraceae bacterium]|mgnify:CR=1 FL=1|jgi:peptide/nickel transport system ATP-binding protein|uniref:Oligopeptide/dipeptide ABC transporter, ATP-binding protein n=1 Tax=Salipiger profundus TaxID=1229727 RepID=A0A1U7DCM2_9RHOB|nr:MULTISPECIES: ABC transporter ATP-binding protein [Salipiger]APX25927.1 oligopeptide/dipeptide ABC transporter, ATP-binding protein [Salipiger profundus]MAB05051.1 ABC transporter ATP-binding protein [Paracoccaceae bacterium]SFC83007.1 peptide/nickel transport system ATP-binding protein [Salipiger profundus]